MHGALRKATHRAVLIAAIASLAFTLTVGCGGPIAAAPVDAPPERDEASAPGEASPERDEWVLVTIVSGRIAPQQAAGVAWDDVDPGSEERDRRSLSAIGQVMNFAADSALPGLLLNVAGAFASDPRDAEAPVGAPDPVVEVRLDQGVTVERWSSLIVRNSLSPSWDESFFLRPSELGAAGLGLVVYDVESSPEERTEIGRIALSRADLFAAVDAVETQELSFRDGALSELRVRISRPDRRPPRVTTVRAPLRSGLTRSGVFVPRGAVVGVRATGEGRVGTWTCTGDVGPAGHSSDDCRRYNLGPAAARAAAHGSAIVLVGREPDIGAFPIVEEDGTGATHGSFVASAGGELLVGINDQDETNNSGEFVFEIAVMAP